MNIGKIGDYVKAHPWITGTVVIIGGLVFILLSGWFTGGASASTTASSGQPTDAQVAAAASEFNAQLGAQTQLNLANTAANVQTQHDADALQLGLANVAAGVTSSNNALQATLAGITAQQQVQTQSISAQQAVALQQIAEQGHEADVNAGLQQSQIAANENTQNNLINFLTTQSNNQTSLQNLQMQLSNAQWLYSQQNRK